MKTMIKNGEIVRVSEKEQYSFLERDYEYCSKQLWKDNVRVLKQKKEKIKESINDKIK